MEDDFEDDRGGDIREYIDNQGHWLDYKVEREFTSSEPPTRLLRFMPIEQYLSILTTKALYIPKATEYDDPYDCAFPGSLSDAIRQALVGCCDEPEFSLPGELDHSKLVEKAEDILSEQLADEFSEEVPERWFVSCWHAGEALTDLMWRSYGGHKGVCIQLSGAALLNQLRDTCWVKRFTQQPGRNTDKFEFLHGYVDYESPVFEVNNDQDFGPKVLVRHAAFHKQRFFRLDQEYRFAMRMTAKDAGGYFAGAGLDLSSCDAVVSTSPLCPEWIAKSLAAITGKYLPTVKFEKLSLEAD
jgi:hypothetical protein